MCVRGLNVENYLSAWRTAFLHLLLSSRLSCFVCQAFRSSGGVACDPCGTALRQRPESLQMLLITFLRVCILTSSIICLCHKMYCVIVILMKHIVCTTCRKNGCKCQYQTLISSIAVDAVTCPLGASIGFWPWDNRPKARSCCLVKLRLA